MKTHIFDVLYLLVVLGLVIFWTVKALSVDFTFAPSSQGAGHEEIKTMGI